MREHFECNCGGEVKVITVDRVLHDCRNKYAPSGSYYTGIPCFVIYHRVQVNLKLIDGAVKYNWFVERG